MKAAQQLEGGTASSSYTSVEAGQPISFDVTDGRKRICKNCKDGWEPIAYDVLSAGNSGEQQYFQQNRHVGGLLQDMYPRVITVPAHINIFPEPYLVDPDAINRGAGRQYGRKITGDAAPTYVPAGENTVEKTREPSEPQHPAISQVPLLEEPEIDLRKNVEVESEPEAVKIITYNRPGGELPEATQTTPAQVTPRPPARGVYGRKQGSRLTTPVTVDGYIAQGTQYRPKRLPATLGFTNKQEEEEKQGSSTEVDRQHVDVNRRPTSYYPLENERNKKAIVENVSDATATRSVGTVSHGPHGAVYLQPQTIKLECEIPYCTKGVSETVDEPRQTIILPLRLNYNFFYALFK